LNLTEFFRHIADNEPKYQKKLILSMALLIFLLVAAVSLNVYRQGQVSEIFAGKIQDAQTIALTAEYEHNQKILSGSQKLIAPKGEVEQIQNRLLQKMGGNNLEVVSISLLPPKDETATDSTEYEAVVTGQWENISRFLRGLKDEPHIINLTSVRLEVTGTESQPIIKCAFNYQIYFESGGLT
jgi:Tfp pilus assembly protein PilO